MAALLAAAGAVLALILFGRMPADSLWAVDLNNFAHGPAFAVLALIMIAVLRRRRARTLRPAVEYALTLAAAVLLGAIVEVMQAEIGRDAQRGDVLRDALGALAALGFLSLVDRKVSLMAAASRLRVAGFLVAFTATAALAAPMVISAFAYWKRHRDFPVLAEFEQPYSTYFVARLAKVSAHREALPAGMALQADRAFGLHIEPLDRRWWGVKLREPRPDWRKFERLMLTIANPATVPLRLRVRIRDSRQESTDPPSVAAVITIAPESVGTAEAALRPPGAADPRPPLDLANVESLMVAPAGQEPTPAFYLLRVWLE